MEAFIFLGILGAVHFFCFFLDSIFKSCMHYPYLEFLKNVGLEVKFLQIKYTTSFNRRILVKINNSVFWKFLIKWFNVGVLASLALLPLGIIILFMTLFNKSEGGGAAIAESSNSYTNQRLELLIPGVNLPIEQIGFYFTALLISTFVHEIGHALAAIVEGVQVTGFGFQLYFIIPVAFTEISSENMNSVNWLKQLRILCGGIWHNICLSFLCFMILSFFGVLSGPFYEHNQGVVITDISPNSYLISETNGLKSFDVVHTINDCRVQNVDDWRRCLKESLKNASKLGYCVNQEYLSLNDQSTPIFYDDNGLVQCCESKNTKASCFENQDSNQYNCLEIRKTIEVASTYCYDKKCQEEESCLHPILSNHTTIYSFIRRDQSLPFVIYVGHPLDVLRTVSVSEHIPKTNFFPAEFADMLLLFLKYNVIFSLGLAVINAVPCFGFDGYHITNTIVNRFFLHRIKKRDKRNVIAFLITSFCTFLFVIAAVKIIWLSLLAKYFK